MALFEQGQVVQYDTLKHASVSLGQVVEALPDPGVSWDRIRRVVVRNLSTRIDWRCDGQDPSTDGFPSLADEVVVLDTDFTQFQMVAPAGTVDVRIIYFGI